MQPLKVPYEEIVEQYKKLVGELQHELLMRNVQMEKMRERIEEYESQTPESTARLHGMRRVETAGSSPLASGPPPE
jgi:hypothetical protein